MDPVLIVDDEPAVLRLVQRLLDKHGIRSQTAPGAVEAVALLSQQDFSAILLDYYLEDGPSWPVLEAARSSPVGPPVIMMTAQGEEWLAAEAVQRGAADFRIKSDLFWKELPGIVQRAARQAEADHAQALLASIVESSGDAIVGLTAQGLILSWNGAAEKMFGHNQAEALGRALSDFVIPESGSELEQVLAGACCTSDCLEAQGVLPGGERLDLSLTVSRIRARTGKASACAIARDVSPQKQAQRQLQVRLEQRAAVAELGRQALQGCQTQQLLEQAVALAAEALGVEFAEILERVPDPEDAPEGHPFQPSAFQGRLKRRSGCGWTGDDPDAPIDESRGWFTLGCRQPVLSQDLSAETRFEPSAALRRHRAASGLSVVIEAAPDPFGVFGVYSSSPRRFTPDDSNFLQSLANVLGSAIQRVRTQEASLERNRLMAFEAEVFRALSQHVDAAALLSACLAAMVTHLGARLARAWLLDRGQDVLQLAATAGNHTQTEVGYQRIPVGQYKVGRIAQTGRPELSNSFLTDSDVAFPEWAARDQIVGFAGHPLIVEGRVEGVLAMFSSQPLSPSLSTVLQSVADGIAQALARLRSQAALRQSKQRLDLLVRQSPLAVIEWTVGGEVSAWNPAAEAIFGNTPEEALGLKWTDLIPHDHVQRLRARWEDVTRKAQHSIHDHVTRSGAIISCEWFSAPLVEDGQVVGIASLCRDCTETSRADEELRKLRHALEQSPVAVMLTDGQGSIEYVNPRFVEMSGYSASEALGQKPSLAKSGFHPPEFYKQLWSTILSGRVFHGEMCNRRKNGEVYWQKAVIAPVRDGQGRITSFIAFQEEMTGRKLIESQLAASEEKFKGIFDSMQDGYVTADIAGFLTLVNPAAVRLFGYRDAAELLAVPCRELFADKQERNALLGTMLELGQRADQRGTIRRKDGTLRIFEGSSRTQPGPDGQPRSVEALFRDVTERSQAEADRQARQAADVANRLKSQFLAHMSHEIRTPLHAILGMTHLALGTQLNERQRHYLEHIQRGGRALLAIVNDILDFSKVEAGKLQLELVEFGLDEVIENLVSVLAGKADEKGLEFIVRVAPEVPAHLLGDPMRLGQVLINLVGNAIK
ncbi:MAG: PAS domain S-box protein, partial [Armatimonadetes bacterium]|nr:PAS domain S-box protein [Armatimonadota bacterium]